MAERINAPTMANFLLSFKNFELIIPNDANEDKKTGRLKIKPIEINKIKRN